MSSDRQPFMAILGAPVTEDHLAATLLGHQCHQRLVATQEGLVTRGPLVVLEPTRRQETCQAGLATCLPRAKEKLRQEVCRLLWSFQEAFLDPLPPGQLARLPQR